MVGAGEVGVLCRFDASRSSRLRAVHVTQRIASARAGLIVCAVLAVVLRWPAYGMPWDRDASVYAVIGRGLGWGDLPYRDLFDHKQPLIYPVYGVIDALGISPRRSCS